MDELKPCVMCAAPMKLDRGVVCHVAHCTKCAFYVDALPHDRSEAIKEYNAVHDAPLPDRD